MRLILEKTAAVKRFLFSEKEWSGFTWLLKIIMVYCSAAIILAMVYTFTPAGLYMKPLLLQGGFPVYVLIAGLLLGVPAFSLCRAVVAAFPAKAKGLPLVLGILALYCACVIAPQIFLPGLLPVFTSILVTLSLCFLFLYGFGYILFWIVKDIRRSMRGRQ